ncbi:MAG: group II intron reverse transcriptase/maturase [Pseudobdellovibrionaceae bacterium]
MQNKHLGEKLEGRKPFVGSRRTDRLHDEQDPFSLKTNQIMEAVVEAPNLRRALAQVKSNKGSAGVDKMTVEELPSYLTKNWEQIKKQLLTGKYKPSPVRRVEIPKSDGGKRQLGIPTVLDRFIQQAVGQVLSQIYEPTFSASSFGFRPNRSAQDAIKQSKKYVQEGRKYVVDIDLEKFFDKVQHDKLMNILKERIKDARVLRLIRNFLKAGVLIGGIFNPSEEGTPQGGPLSPLLSNIILDKLDKELERRGHKFCRYADDCNTYVKSRRSGERLMTSITHFIENSLRLVVNTKKSAVAYVAHRKFLGFVISRNKDRVSISPHQKSVRKFKKSVKILFRKGRGRNIPRFITEDLNPVLRGWHQHFKVSDTTYVFKELDEWVRRRIRMLFWRQWKNAKTRNRKMLIVGIKPDRAKECASNGRGPWWNSNKLHMSELIPIKYLRSLGLYSFIN